MPGTWSDSNRRRAMIIALIALFLITGFVVWSFSREKPTKSSSDNLARGSSSAEPGSASSASQSRSTGSVASESKSSAEPARPAELVRLDKSSQGVGSKLTHAGSSGKIFFIADELNYTIDRDYAQWLAVEVENRGKERIALVADIFGLDRDLLGSFVGSGSAGQPLTVAVGAKATLALHLFAQDARRAGYFARIEAKDAKSGEVLAWAPLTINLRVPAFKISVKTGEPEPGTLGLPITVTNEGGPITDFAVRPDKSLAGRISFQPSISHANLPSGASMTFTALPRLNTGFTGLEGELVLSGAGQEQRVKVKFPLPPGQKVFVATSFSTESRSGFDWYCTNRPSVDTPLGGFIGGPISPWSPSNPWLPQGQVTWQWMSIGGIPLKTTFGPSPIGVSNPTGNVGGGRTGSIPPLNITGSSGSGGSAGSAGSGDPHQDVDPSVQPMQDDHAAPSAANTQIGSQFSGGDEHMAAYPPTGGTMHGAPRGKISAPYAHHRTEIDKDNEPECAIAVSPGEPGKRLLVQAWHTERWCGETGRQIVLRAWDGQGQRTLTRPILLSDGKSFDQWPCVLALPNSRALAVWESCPKADGKKSLVFRICEPGFATWSDTTPLPGAQASETIDNDSACAALDSTGRVVIVWHQKVRDESRLMLTRTTDKGDFAQAIALEGLPAGACCPMLRAGNDGSLHLVFQAAINDEGPDVHFAVWYTALRDGGKTFASLKRLSNPKLDASQADLLVDGDTLHVVFRTGADWHSRIRYTLSKDDGKTWSDPADVSPEDRYGEYPSLVLRPDKKIGLEYYGDTAGEPKGKASLKRFTRDLTNGSWSEERRLLTHFPTITAAWLQTNFRLRNNREEYQPHEMSILLNGKEVFSQKNAIPEGNYLVPVDPMLLRVDENGQPRNIIGVRTKHMIPGHYSTATQFRLQARHTFLERLVIAKSQEEADATLRKEYPDLNHSLPDVGLFAAPGKEGALIKTTPKDGDIIKVPLVLANLGEVSANNVRIDVFGEAPDAQGHPLGKPLAKSAVTVGELKPLELRTIEVEFPFAGKENYYIVAQLDGTDFDASNNVHVVSFLVPKPPTIQPAPREPADEFELRTVDEDGNPEYWRLIEDGTNREVARAERFSTVNRLSTGEYRLALKRYLFEGKEIVFPDKIKHTEGVKQRLTLRTAIEIELPEDVPNLYGWEAVQADKPDEVVQSQSGGHRIMLLPPGKYRIAIKPIQFDCQRLVWPVDIELKEDQHVTIKLDSFIKLETAPGAAIYHWAVIPAGKPKESETVQWQTGDHRLMLVPPGKYQVAIAPYQFDCRRLVWSTEIEVKGGKQVKVNLDSAIKLETPTEAAIYHWAVVPAGKLKESETVQWQTGDHRLMLVPPGKYQVAIAPYQFNCQRLVWTTEIEVKENEQVPVRLNSGIKIEFSKDVDPPYHWAAIPAGKPDTVIQWQVGKAATMLVPPGKYQVIIRPTQFNSESVTWPQELEVKDGGLTMFTLDTGIRIVGPKDAKPEFDFQIVDPETKKAVQWGVKTWAVQMVPAGTYRVEVRADGNAPWKPLAEKVTVEAGKITEVKMAEQPGK